MLYRILVIILLMMVEVSTLRECFSEFKQQIEVQDIEDSSESEDISKEFTLENYLVESLCFQFRSAFNLNINTICDHIATIIRNPFQVIDSPPPKQ